MGLVEEEEGLGGEVEEKEAGRQMEEGWEASKDWGEGLVVMVVVRKEVLVEMAVN